MASFAEAYHWTFEDIVKLTPRQIILINHAAWVNKKRTDAKMKFVQDVSRPAPGPKSDGMPTWNGKRIDQLTSKEYLLYQASGA